MALDPQALAQLQSWYNQGSPTSPYLTLGDWRFGKEAPTISHAGEDSYSEVVGNPYIMATPTAAWNDAGASPYFNPSTGQQYFHLDPTTGNVTEQGGLADNQGFFGGLADAVKGTVKDLGPAAALFASMYLGGQGLGALAGAGAASGAGAGAGAAAGAGSGAVGGSGAFLGEGALSGIPAWDGALTGAQAAGAAGTAAGGAGGLPSTDAGYMNGMDAVSDAATTSGIAPAGTVNAGVGTSWMPSPSMPWSQLGQKALSQLGSALSKQGQSQQAGAGGASLPSIAAPQSQYGGTPGYYSIASQAKPSYWNAPAQSPYFAGLMNMGGSQ